MILRRIVYGEVSKDSLFFADGRFFTPTKNEVGLEIAGGVLDGDDPREVWEEGLPEPLHDWMYVKELEMGDSCKRRKLA